MMMYRVLLFIFLFPCFPDCHVRAQSGQKNIVLGAYYFNGWSGYTNHVTPELQKSFKSRKPIWGWYANSAYTMEREIKHASEAGINFFSFCWYYVNSDSTRYRNHPLNQALGLFINSPNSALMNFNLLVANHEGATIGPADWMTVSKEWIRLFKQPRYLLCDGKPLITFFSLKTLVSCFKTSVAVSQALNSLRDFAIREGLSGVSIAVCVNGSKAETVLAKQCGFDVLTGYNYHYAGFTDTNSIISIDRLINGSTKIWDSIETNGLPYIPAVTLNWDPRPWASLNNKNAISRRYVGFSPESVYKSIVLARDWIQKNPSRATQERHVVVYAWNEYGEGAWLAPTSKIGNKLLNSVRRALKLSTPVAFE